MFFFHGQPAMRLTFKSNYTPSLYLIAAKFWHVLHPHGIRTGDAFVHLEYYNHVRIPSGMKSGVR